MSFGISSGNRVQIRPLARKAASTTASFAQFLSAALMLRDSFNEQEVADKIEAAVEATLEAGLRTADLARPGEKTVSTVEMGAAIKERLG